MNIAHLFLNAATQYPDKAAIIETDQSISFDDLKNEVLATAAYFDKKGIRKGDRVLVFVPMGIDLYRVVLALFYLGATAVFLDEWVSRKRLALCCRLADCKGFIGITKARVFGFFIKDLRSIPIKLSLKGRLAATFPIAEAQPDDAALITFTTGSTGTPKAALRSHAFLKEQFDALLDEIEPSPEDIDLCTLPIVLFVNLGVGCTSVIAPFKQSKPEKIDMQAIYQLAERTQVSRITSSPFFLKTMASYLWDSTRTLKSVQKLFTGGAPVFPNEAQLYIDFFPQAQIKIVYGSTEAEPISSIDAHDLVTQTSAMALGLPVGQPYHKAEVRIIGITHYPIEVKHHDFGDLTLNEGKIGEIIVSGPHVLKTYFNNEDAFKQNKIVVGDTVWHRTGDSGFLKNGELFLTGRCQQLIETTDGWLSPFIIENELQLIPEVSLGTLLKVGVNLVLIVETSLNETALRKALNGKSMPFDRIKLVKSIPRDPRHHSKIDYGRLQELLQTK